MEFPPLSCAERLAEPSGVVLAEHCLRIAAAPGVSVASPTLVPLQACRSLVPMALTLLKASYDDLSAISTLIATLGDR
jgi:hypothetical protein